MTGTKDEELALLDREFDFDTEKAAEVIENRAKDMQAYHANILALARPVIRELLVLHCASLDDLNGKCDVLAGIAMALGDSRLMTTLKTRVAKVRATVTTEAARQKALPQDLRDLPPLTGRG